MRKVIVLAATLLIFGLISEALVEAAQAPDYASNKVRSASGQSLDELLTAMNTVPPAAAPHDESSGQPWTPSLVTCLSISLLVFGLIICGLSAFLLCKDKNVGDVIRAFALPLIIVSAVMLVVAGYSDRQITSVIGLLGTIAGYLLGSRAASREAPLPAVSPSTPSK